MYLQKFPPQKKNTDTLLPRRFHFLSPSSQDSGLLQPSVVRSEAAPEFAFVPATPVQRKLTDSLSFPVLDLSHTPSLNLEMLDS